MSCFPTRKHGRTIWPAGKSVSSACRMFVVSPDDDGHIVNILYDSNNDFADDGEPSDQEDVLAVYDADHPALRSIDDGAFTMAVPGSLAMIVVDFPAAAQDAAEPDDDDAAQATVLPSVQPVSLLAGHSMRSPTWNGSLAPHQWLGRADSRCNPPVGWTSSTSRWRSVTWSTAAARRTSMTTAACSVCNRCGLVWCASKDRRSAILTRTLPARTANRLLSAPTQIGERIARQIGRAAPHLQFPPPRTAPRSATSTRRTLTTGPLRAAPGCWPGLRLLRRPPGT